jgi:hypothetical protein
MDEHNNENRRLQFRISELNKERWEHYRKWESLSNEYNKAQKKLENICTHNWDMITISSGRTRYDCKKCKAYR